jgi:protocatechuate 3,4-dioxygenase beta subunit
MDATRKPDQPPNNDPESEPSRRRALILLGGAGLGLVAAACAKSGLASGDPTNTTPGTGSTTSTTAPAGSTGSTVTTATATCSPIPEETAGPYPGDGSNGPNVLNQDGVVRSDIRSSFGSASGVADGVPLQIDLQIVDVANGCAPFAGAAVYIWHCDIDGKYSMYSQGVTNENYLRGVQESDEDGRLRFLSIFPAAYSGRWPHIHFEVYPSLASATSARNKIATSQLALPEDVCDAVYATGGYSASLRNMARTSLATDNVFRDGATQETPSVTGNVTDGYVASFVVPV